MTIVPAGRRSGVTRCRRGRSGRRLTCGSVRLRTHAAAALAALAGLGGCSLGDDPDQRRPAAGHLAPTTSRAPAKLGFPSTATKQHHPRGRRRCRRRRRGRGQRHLPGHQREPPADRRRARRQGRLAGRRDRGGAGGQPDRRAAAGVRRRRALRGHRRHAQAPEAQGLRPLASDAQVIRIGSDAPAAEGLQDRGDRGQGPLRRARPPSTASSPPPRASRRPTWSSPRASRRTTRCPPPPGRRAPATPCCSPGSNALPAATRRALRAHDKPNIFVLGPERVISPKVERSLRRLGRVRRIQGANPVANAIAFAPLRERRLRLGSGGAGLQLHPRQHLAARWTPRRRRSSPRRASSPRSLLTDQAGSLPKPLEDYLLSVQPGFEDDPGQAVYNRVWILGDDGQVSVEAQARLDQLTELIPVQSNAP